jgi:phosphoserine phosphatase
VTSARRSAAFFDLDKTVIARSSTLAFSRPFYAGGLITRSAVLRSAYAHFLFLAGGAAAVTWVVARRRHEQPGR